MSAPDEQQKYEGINFQNGSGADTMVGIIGNGNYGRALALRLAQSGISHYVGSRTPTRRKLLNAEHKLLSNQEVALKGQIIFIAIPRQSYDKIIPPLATALKGKIVVDISNPTKRTDPCNAMHLAKLLPNSHVMKAFNTVSAWAMENDVFGGSRKTFICGNDVLSKATLMQLVREIGFNPVDMGRLNRAKHIENIPLQLFPEWRNAVKITLAVLAFELFYYYLRLFGAEKKAEKDKNKLPLYHGNRIVCWMAIWLLALVYLPGCVAGFLQLYNGTKYKPFPNWLDQWMKSRKQLGLIALFFAGIHACMSVILLGGEYIFRMSKHVPIPGTNLELFREFKWNVEPSLLFATLSMAFFTVLGITSLPTVNARMTWREWDFIQSRIGYLTMLFATAHVLLYAYSVFDPARFKFYHWNMPPAVYLQPLLPIIVMLLKLILLLPGINGRLERIREGLERDQPEDSANEDLEV